jgi:hypothetical protein
LKTSKIVIAFSHAVLLCAMPAHASGKDPEPTGTNPLPTTPPAPDVVLRESFGAGPEDLRPQGDKGRLRNVYAGTQLQGFWVEYLGSWANSWRTGSETAGVTWGFAFCSDNPNEMPSPLQTVYANGCAHAEWRDGVVGFPSALVPFRGLTTPYEVSIDLYPAVLSGASVSLGLTASSVAASNLRTVGQVYLTLKQGPVLNGTQGIYELHTGGETGPLLATGAFWMLGYNPVALRVDPVAQTVSATVDGIAVGTFPVPAFTPAFIAIEGQGNIDNLVVRSVP